MSNLIGHMACPSCPSSDAFAVYEPEDGKKDKNGYCFACSHHAFLDDSFEEKELVSTTSGGDWDWRTWLTENTRQASLDYRGYGLDIRRGARVKEGVDPSTNEVKFVYYPVFEGNKLAAVKIRNIQDKDFRVMGKGIKNHLFGKEQCGLGRKLLIITEGEEDCLAMRAALRAQRKDYSVVSITTGAAGAATGIKSQWDFVTSHQKVVFAFDQDAPGQEAAEQCARMMPSNLEAVIMKLDLKDAGEMMEADRSADLVSAVFAAKKPKPGAIFDPADVERYLSTDEEDSVKWPWASLQALVPGIRFGKLISVGASLKAGKTSWSYELAHYLMKSDVKIGLMSLEDTVQDAFVLLAGMSLNENLIVQDVNKSNRPAFNAKVAKEVKTFSGKMIGYDSALSQEWEDIRSNILYMHAEGCRVIFLDTLTSIIVSSDNMNSLITEIANDLANFCKTLGITIFCFSHVNSPKNGTPHEEGGRVIPSQFYGSRSLARFAHLGIGIVRNQSPEIPREDRNFVGIDVLFNRRWGDNGRVILQYDNESGRLKENHACLEYKIIEGTKAPDKFEPLQGDI